MILIKNETTIISELFNWTIYTYLKENKFPFQNGCLSEEADAGKEDEVKE